MLPRLPTLELHVDTTAWSTGSGTHPFNFSFPKFPSEDPASDLCQNDLN